jgi:signal transduction histidine kinase
VTAVSVFVAFFVLAVIMIINFSGTVRRVNRLANNVKLVEEGNLDMPIILEGNDELSTLAEDVNSMRNAVVDTMSKERQAWEANAELITAMSHDIRTPLTVLLGYLDLMGLQDQNETNAEYIEACKENAMRLKRLSDDMFSYFLVFGKNDLHLDLNNSVDCATLEHMLAEREVLLSELGFTVERSGAMPRASVKLDIAYFSRVIDNIFTNLSKYADSSEPIYVDTNLGSGFLTISVKNRIKSKGERAESNGIGVKTCIKIMELLNGDFEVLNEDEYYTVFLRIPATLAEENNADLTNS